MHISFNNFTMKEKFDLIFEWWKDYKSKYPFSKKEYYNSIPVHCCKECKSLAIIAEDIGDYCFDCGCTETETMSYEDWERKYRFTKIQGKLS